MNLILYLFTPASATFVFVLVLVAFPYPNHTLQQVSIVRAFENELGVEIPVGTCGLNIGIQNTCFPSAVHTAITSDKLNLFYGPHSWPFFFGKWTNQKYGELPQQ